MQKQTPKRKQRRKAVPVLGAAGLSLSLASGASGGPAANLPTPTVEGSHEIFLAEEEISDVSLATFYVFDKENTGSFRPGVQLVRGGCGGCGGGRGCGGCGGRRQRLWGLRLSGLRRLCRPRRLCPLRVCRVCCCHLRRLRRILGRLLSVVGRLSLLLGAYLRRHRRWTWEVDVGALRRGPRPHC